MINIIIPMSGASLYETSSDFMYPKILTEVSNKTLFEYSQEVFSSLDEQKQIIYVVPKEKLNKLGLKTIISIISNDEGRIVPLSGMTKGAVCSALMAIDQINLDEELIIASADHYINDDLQNIVNDFRSKESDAGVLCFESVHPKWSFVKINSDNLIVQASEKIAISRNAIAGLYYFRKGSDFVEAAKNLIRKDNCIDGNFYLSACLNELILMGKKLTLRKLSDRVYHNFYDAHAVKAFELAHIAGKSNLSELTEKYVEAFDKRSLHDVMDFFDKNASLVDPANSLIGHNSIRDMLLKLFNESKELSFTAKTILVESKKSVIEFELVIDGNMLQGVDIISWNNNDKISALNAYLY
jgi:ADP-glucose pyrophosphorylase